MLSRVVGSKQSKYAILLSVLGMFVVFILASGKPVPQPGPVPERLVSVVDVIAVNPQTMSLSIKSQGTVASRREIDLVTEVAGKVISVNDYFAVGGFFSKNEQVLKIDDRDYRYSLIRAEAQVADAEQILATEKGRVRQARREWRDLGNGEANSLFLREPQLTSAEAQLQAAKADRDQARKDLQSSEISAPFNGRIRERYVDLGQYVSKGTKIARIYGTDRFEVKLPITDRQLALIDLPTSNGVGHSLVTLRGIYAGKEWQWDATLIRSDASIDIKSRVVYVVAEIDRPFSETDDLRPALNLGQYVDAEIIGKPLDGVVILPRTTLHKRKYVWLVDSSNSLSLLEVGVLQSAADTVSVRGNFPPGSHVLVSPSVNFYEGMIVSPRQVEYH